MEKDDNRLIRLPQADCLKASGTVYTVRNSWWSCDPENGDLLLYQSEKRRSGKLIGAAPQCNQSESTARMLQKKLYPWASLVFVPLVLLPEDTLS